MMRKDLIKKEYSSILWLFFASLINSGVGLLISTICFRLYGGHLFEEYALVNRYSIISSSFLVLAYRLNSVGVNLIAEKKLVCIRLLATLIAFSLMYLTSSSVELSLICSVQTLSCIFIIKLNEINITNRGYELLVYPVIIRGVFICLFAFADILSGRQFLYIFLIAGFVEIFSIYSLSKNAVAINNEVNADGYKSIDGACFIISNGLLGLFVQAVAVYLISKINDADVGSLFFVIQIVGAYSQLGAAINSVNLRALNKFKVVKLDIIYLASIVVISLFVYGCFDEVYKYFLSSNAEYLTKIYASSFVMLSAGRFLYNKIVNYHRSGGVFNLPNSIIFFELLMCFFIYCGYMSLWVVNIFIVLIVVVISFCTVKDGT